MAAAPCHFLVIALGSHGDLFPLMRIALALQALGRQVTLIAHTHHAPLVRDAGLAFIGLGTEEAFLEVLNNPDIWHPRKAVAALLRDYGQGLKEALAAIESVTCEQPPVVIAHPLAVPAAAIARAQGQVSAVVATYLAPSNLRTCHDPLRIGPWSVPHWVPMGWRRTLWRFVEAGWIDPVALRQVNAVRTPLGLEPVSSFLTHMMAAPDLSATLFPSWFAPTMPDWPRPLLAGDFQLFESSRSGGFSVELSAFLAAGDPPIVFTAGTANRHAVRFFKCALEASQRLGRRAVFLAQDRAQVPASLPATVLWQPYVPLSALLPHAAALVHHGGIGTTAEALRAGLPQVVTPFAWDQFDNGARVAALGVGAVLPARTLRPSALAQKLHRLSAAEYVRHSCQRLAAHFALPHDPITWCAELERRLATSGVHAA